jgi:uncharacterized protein YutE (UPF0331/DUF86 family)
MLKSRNLSVHIYSEIDAETLVNAVFDSYIGAFRRFESTLRQKIEEIES